MCLSLNMTQKAVTVKVEIQDGGLNTDALNALLDDGWTVVETQTSTQGSILVIVQKDKS